MIKKKLKIRNIQHICFGGCNWDAMMLWMNGNGIDVTKSDTNGIQDICPGTPTRSKNTTNPSITGKTEMDKLSNIYDTLGGSWDWGMEASGTGYRDMRGGLNLFSCSPSYRGTFSPDSSSNVCRFTSHNLYTIIKIICSISIINKIIKLQLNYPV